MPRGIYKRTLEHKINISKAKIGKSSGAKGKHWKLSKETLAKRKSKYPLEQKGKPLLYSVWVSMKARCYNKNNKYYNDYGNRGIKVCNRWRENFQNFIEDMEMRPTNKHLLDRINNDLGYAKENCRWTTPSISAINTRIRKDNTTGYKGIYYNKSNKKYCAVLLRNNTRKFLGYFKEKQEAINKYNQYV